LQRATIWIDFETDIALKMQYEGTTEENSSSLEVTTFESFDSLPASAFDFTPPAGAEVVEFTDAAGLKQALSGAYLVPRGSRVIIENDWSEAPPANR
jgi:hypothetical protein